MNTPIRATPPSGTAASPSTWQVVRVVAGAFILLSLLLGSPASPWFHSQGWLAFTAFVGVNLLQSGLTRWCLMERILRRLGLRTEA